MEEKRPQPQESLAHRHQHSVESIITLLEWLVVAFILALMFMTFAMQAFQIPTGSMAETLRGAHYRIRCVRCGHAFDVGNDATSYGRPQCPNCDYVEPPHALGPVNNGDRIFVLKSIYQFFEPKRWDVVVFKNPTNPLDNYIKRLIALPEETVELVNGDVFIDGKIVRKPASVQKELWMPIFLQDYQPLEAAGHFNELILQGQDSNNKAWKPPFENEPNSLWQLENETVFTLGEESGTQHTVVYVPDNRNDFRAFYGYNESAGYSFKPIVSDLMVSFYAKCDDPAGYIGASLEKYGVHYSARLKSTACTIRHGWSLMGRWSLRRRSTAKPLRYGHRCSQAVSRRASSKNLNLPMWISNLCFAGAISGSPMIFQRMRAFNLLMDTTKSRLL
jgi:signal peptidase I